MGPYRQELPARRHVYHQYVLRHPEVAAKLVARAKAADYEALMVTVDLPVGGKRERDFHNDFTIPFSPTARNLIDFVRRPGWLLTSTAGEWYLATLAHRPACFVIHAMIMAAALTALGYC